MKRQPVRGQAAKWCVCGEWFASERDEREHAVRCPGPRERGYSVIDIPVPPEGVLRETEHPYPFRTPDNGSAGNS